MKETGRDFDIIYISNDKNKAQFDEYYAEMPWIALPYELRESKAKLYERYRIRNMPQFILIDGYTGKGKILYEILLNIDT